MARGNDDPLGVIMQDLRARLEARVRAGGEVATRLRALAASYQKAVKADAEAELERRQGGHAPPPDPSPARLAAELFELVAALPELHDDPEREPVRDAPASASAATQPDPVSFHELMSTAGQERPGPARTPRATQPHPGVLRLMEDFRGRDLDALSTPMFRAVAEELAARARLLQSQGAADPDQSTDYVIRALTAASDKRGIRNIYGLRRTDQADWAKRAKLARRQQEKPGVALPEPKRVAAGKKQDDADDDDDEPRRPWQVPRLATRASAGAVVIVGGVVKPEKLDRLREHLGFNVEWLGTSVHGSTSALERRIREGHVAAVVMLEGLISHKHSEQVVAATRQAGVPLAYGGTGGLGKLEEAFEQIEASLR